MYLWVRRYKKNPVTEFYCGDFFIIRKKMSRKSRRQKRHGFQ